MKINIVAVLILALSLGFNAMAEQPARQQWEYATLFFSPRDLEKPYSWTTARERISNVNERQLIKKLRNQTEEPLDTFYLAAIGEQGWELVGVGVGTGGTGSSTYIFKRIRQVHGETATSPATASK